MDYDILYKSTMPIRLKGYTNVDWVGYKDDRLKGFIFSIVSWALFWSSKKQSTLILSSREAEYRGTIMLHVKSHGSRGF